MTWTDLRYEIINWRITKYKVINLSIGVAALLIYELAARPFYRPYIYVNKIFDFHIADTLGSSLGTIATIFILVGLFTRESTKGLFIIGISIFSLVVYELVHPVFGKPIDIWDILATTISGVISFILFRKIFDRSFKN